MDIFLRAKHWQLFSLMFGLPIVFDIFIFANVFGAAASGNPLAVFNVMRFFPIIMVLFMGLMFGWFWSIAIHLQAKVPAHIKMKTGLFKAFFFIPLGYITCLLIFISCIFNNLPGNMHPDTGLAIVSIIAVIVPLHLFSMFCIFYCLYFVAKTLKTVEMQKEVTFSDFAGDFFLIWFYPIGIWIIQPRINKLMEEEFPQP